MKLVHKLVYYIEDKDNSLCSQGPKCPQGEFRYGYCNIFQQSLKTENGKFWRCEKCLRSQEKEGSKK